MSSYYEKLLATGEVKCIDEEIPFEIPKGWEWCRLASVSFSIADGDHMPPPKSFDGIPFIVISNMAKGVLDLNTSRYVPVEYYENLSKERIPQKNDILFSVTGSYGIAVRILTADVFCFQRHIALIKPMLASAEYIELLLNSPLIRTQCNKTATGMAQKTVGIDSLRRFLVPIPPFQEQIKIVEKCNLLEPFIRKYSEAQEKLNRINEEINEVLKKSILQEAIQGKLVPQIAEEGTAHDLLEQIKAEKQKLVKEGKLKKSALASSVIFRSDDNKYYEQIGKKYLDITEHIPFDIPANWRWIRLGQGISLLSGRDLGPTQYNDLHHGMPYVTGASNFVNSRLLINRWTDSPITIANKGDLLLTCKGTIGAMAFNDIGQIHIARQVMSITSLGIDLKYIKCFLQSSLSILEKNANSMIPGISRSVLLDILFPIPPLKEQQRIVAQIEKLFEQLR